MGGAPAPNSPGFTLAQRLWLEDVLRKKPGLDELNRFIKINLAGGSEQKRRQAWQLVKQIQGPPPAAAGSARPAGSSGKPSTGLRPDFGSRLNDSFATDHPVDEMEYDDLRRRYLAHIASMSQDERFQMPLPENEAKAYLEAGKYFGLKNPGLVPLLRHQERFFWNPLTAVQDKAAEKGLQGEYATLGPVQMSYITAKEHTGSVAHRALSGKRQS